MSTLRFSNPVFVAIDTPDLNRALAVAKAVGPHVGGLKVGLEFITARGPDGVRAITALGRPVFADVKFHDIPNTVAGAAREIAKLGVSMFNIHASGGEAMMRAAKDAAASINPGMKVIAVTVLTSMDEMQLKAVGVHREPGSQVELLARMGLDAGIRGFVCSPNEVHALRAMTGPGGTLVVPGIRPAGSAAGDQKRIATPADALRAGASYLVVGRPITQAADPAEAAERVLEEMAAALGE